MSKDKSSNNSLILGGFAFAIILALLGGMFIGVNMQPEEPQAESPVLELDLSHIDWAQIETEARGINPEVSDSVEAYMVWLEAEMNDNPEGPVHLYVDMPENVVRELFGYILDLEQAIIEEQFNAQEAIRTYHEGIELIEVDNVNGFVKLNIGGNIFNYEYTPKK